MLKDRSKRGILGASIALLAGSDYYFSSITGRSDSETIFLLLLVLIGGLAYIDYGTTPK